jgi:3-carboxy-cis,cis-muconate cycloisomerase
MEPGFTTLAMAEVFSPVSRVAAMLEFEAALVMALADSGFVEVPIAEAVAAACQEPPDDPVGALAATWTEGTPLLPLLEGIRARLPEDEARWLHFGATTQDALDTATMLLARRALEVLDPMLLEVAGLMAGLAKRHRDQPQMGRTFLQHARPTTFGYTVAGWLNETAADIADLRDVVPGLAVQLGGPVGNLSEYGEKGLEVVEALARRLGLAAPPLPWHTDRSRVASLASALERTARTMARVGLDVALLASSDIAEISVRGGGSSSMAGKQNPMDSVRAVAASELCTSAAQVITGGRLTEMERGVGGWHAESAALSQVFETTAAAVEAMTACLASLEVDSDRMAARVDVPPAIDPRLIDQVLAGYESLLP